MCGFVESGTELDFFFFFSKPHSITNTFLQITLSLTQWHNNKRPYFTGPSVCRVSGCMEDMQSIWPHIHEHATLAMIKVVLASHWLGRPGKDVERICDTRTWIEVIAKADERSLVFLKLFFVLFFKRIYGYSGKCYRIRVLLGGWWKHGDFISFIFFFNFMFI